jgi:hypothetical protein
MTNQFRSDCGVILKRSNSDNGAIANHSKAIAEGLQIAFKAIAKRLQNYPEENCRAIARQIRKVYKDSKAIVAKIAKRLQNDRGVITE